MEERKNTHFAGTCKFKVVETKSDSLLILLPVEIIDGTLTEDKKFIDTDGEEFEEAYEAFMHGKDRGYSRPLSFNYVLKQGTEKLRKFYGYVKTGKMLDDEISAKTAFKSEYFLEFENLIWYYDLNDLAPILVSSPDDEFSEMYGIYVDTHNGAVTYIDDDDELDDAEIARRKKRVEELKAEFTKQAEVQKPNESEPQKVVATPKDELPKVAKPVLTRLQLIEETKKFVIAQDEAIDEIVSAIYEPITYGNPNLFHNILLYGPTGVGKTLIISTIARLFGLPYCRIDLSKYSASGYEGRSVDNISLRFYHQFGGNIKKLESGLVIHIDEGDKDVGIGGPHDVKTQVYNELLDLCQRGQPITIKKGDYDKEIEVRTDNFFVFISGSFERMAKNNKGDIGFGSSGGIKDPNRMPYYSPDDFIKFGIPKEFIGRQPKIIRLNALSKEDLYKILTTAPQSVYLQVLKSLHENGFNLNIPEAALMKIVEVAATLGTGARSLDGKFDMVTSVERRQIMDSRDAGITEPSEYTIDEGTMVKRLGTYMARYGKK